MLKRSKEKFKSELLTSAEEFKKAVTLLEEEFTLRGPVSSKTVVNEALAATKAFSQQVESLKEQEVTIKKGLNIFKIEQQQSKALLTLQKNIEYLEQVTLLIY